MSLVFLKVWDSSRKKKALVYLSENEEDLLVKLISKASTKLDINGATLVLEKDGTLIDEDIFLKHFKDETFLLLEPQEQWREEVSLSDITNSSRASSTLSTLTLMEDIIPSQTEDSDNVPSVVITHGNTDGENSNNVSIYQIDCNQQFMWQLFQIPWEQFPPEMVVSYEKGERDKHTINYIIHTVVNQMRSIKKIIPSSAIKIVTKKLIDKYPKTFRDIDEDNVVIGDGSYSVFKKIQDRNNYLNRPHKSKRKSNDNPVPNKKWNQSERAGCSHWDPPVDVDETTTRNLEPLDENKENFKKNFIARFAEQRSFLNDNPHIETIKEEWPTLLTENGALLHFSKLTGSDLTNIEEAVEEKIEKFHKLYPEQIICESKVLELLKILEAHFKENLKSLYIELEKLPDSMEELQLELHPTIIRIGLNEDFKYFVLYERQYVDPGGHHTFTKAFQVSFALFLNFNLKYPANISLSLEFIQRYFLKIYPDSGTKSKRAGFKKVLNLMNRMRKL